MEIVTLSNDTSTKITGHCRAQQFTSQCVFVNKSHAKLIKIYSRWVVMSSRKFLHNLKCAQLSLEPTNAWHRRPITSYRMPRFSSCRQYKVRWQSGPAPVASAVSCTARASTLIRWPSSVSGTPIPTITTPTRELTRCDARQQSVC